MSPQPATCQFDDLQVSLLQRMSGLTGRTAATQISDERRLWADSSRGTIYRNFAKVCSTSHHGIDRRMAAD